MRGIFPERMLEIVQELESISSDIMLSFDEINKQLFNIESSYDSDQLNFLVSYLRKSLNNFGVIDENIQNEIKGLRDVVESYYEQDQHLTNYINASIPK